VLVEGESGIGKTRLLHAFLSTPGGSRFGDHIENGGLGQLVVFRRAAT
jgi:hypothetical protein